MYRKRKKKQKQREEKNGFCPESNSGPPASQAISLLLRQVKHISLKPFSLELPHARPVQS